MPANLPLNVARFLRQQLESWQAAGVTLLQPASAEWSAPAPSDDSPPSDSPPAASPHPPPASRSADMPRPSARSKPAPELSFIPPAAPAEPEAAAATPLTLAARVERLNVLREAVRGCVRCGELATTRKQTVFGVGNPEARILFIGEAPGADEDEQGEPFVGRAGQLLNQIIAACRLKREQVYICNILKCRPPANRTPAPDECANCREYLDGQLTTIDPEYIVCWGTVAAQNLLRTDVTIGKLRRRLFSHGRAKVLCTYHPSYLLRNPAAKKDVWDDMKFLFADMGVDLSSKE